ncbi:hypothetical protein EVAR_103994_1 [Eumeta japonica]|uniref:Uncharacterized protein n=1 Tax=Eumeta variegata TaxID=151549 RepID=A0A4C1XZA4_EUMVA|nr:hypothetical protein EVAR_103994_1 [Eumeta japonica]
MIAAKGTPPRVAGARRRARGAGGGASHRPESSLMRQLSAEIDGIDNIRRPSRAASDFGAAERRLTRRASNNSRARGCDDPPRLRDAWDSTEGVRQGAPAARALPPSARHSASRRASQQSEHSTRRDRKYNSSV